MQLLQVSCARAQCIAAAYALRNLLHTQPHHAQPTGTASRRVTLLTAERGVLQGHSPAAAKIVYSYSRSRS